MEKIIYGMIKYLPQEIISYILNMVDEHHIKLGHEKWRHNFVNIHAEYEKKFILMWTCRDPHNTYLNCDENDIVQEVSLVNMQHYQDCSEFDHDFSCRSFNYRYHDCVDCLMQLTPWHCIKNSMKVKKTQYYLPDNYFHQKLFI